MPVFDSNNWCGQKKEVLHGFLEQLTSIGTGILWRGQIEDSFKQFLKSFENAERKSIRDTLGKKIAKTQGALVIGDSVIFLLRPIAGVREAFSLSRKEDRIETMDLDKYLALREAAATGSPSEEEFSFSIDFYPFRIFNPEKPDPKLIGKGIERLSKIFISKIHENPNWVLNSLISYLSHRKHDGRPLFFKQTVDIVELHRVVERALELVDTYNTAETRQTLLAQLGLLGLAEGWGATAERMRETFLLLESVLHDPTVEDFKALMSRLPLTKNVLLVSVHGWFAQKNVLGRPDTGGQIVYILNQARALERHMKALWGAAGVHDVQPKVIILSRLIPEADGTTCNLVKEQINGTENSYIFRIPFRSPDGEVVPGWMSRFKVWPYLAHYTKEAYHQLMVEFGGSPDLIIGNYSDGNMVATALGREWGSTTGVIAHALEKNKYLFSDVNWKEMEKDYHFSAHFLNDLLSSNSADFIMTSTYQEIAGTEQETGQYEAYGTFTLPQNYRVRSGIDVYTPHFIINPPGYDPDNCFPYTEKTRRKKSLIKEVEDLCFSKKPPKGAVGAFKDPSKPPIFSMARLDKIKNIAGLVKAYASNKELQERANLVIVGGVTSEKSSNDIEEKHQIKGIHKLIKKYKLSDKIRWLPGETDPERGAEFYRVMAERGGVFVQPALYEAFGLTVIESMICGLPVIATRYGGPSESIEDGVSGILINPHKSADISKAILRLISPNQGATTKSWQHVSEGGIHRAESAFSWSKHVASMEHAAALYGFWNHLFSRDYAVQLNYVDAIYYLLLLPRIKAQ